MRSGARIAIAALVFLVLWAGAAFAYDQTVVGEAERTAQGFNSDLAAIDKSLQLPILSDTQLTEFRSKIEDIRGKAQSQASKLADPIGEVTQQIAQLGLLPADGGAEPPTLAIQRAKLTADLTRLTGIKSQLDLALVTADQLASRASALQRTLFLTRIFEGGRSVVNPELWRDTGVGIGQMVQRLSALYSNWWADVRTTANFAGLALIPLLLAVFAGIYLLLRGGIRRWVHIHLTSNRSPGDIDRLWRIVRAVAAMFAVLLVVFMPVYLSLEIAGFMTPRFALVMHPLVDIVFVTAVYWAIALRVAAPGQPQWRIVDLDDAAAARLPVLVGLTAFVSVATRSLGEIADDLYLPVTYTIGQSALSAIIMLLLMALILIAVRNQDGLPGKTPGRRLYFTWGGSFVPLIWVAIASGLVALLAGYIALASYISQQVFETAVLLATLFLLHHLSDAAVASSFDPQSGFGRFLRRLTGLGERGIERLGLLFRIAVDLLLVVAGLPLLFLLWTFTWVDFRSLLNSALFGFKVGNITLSPGSLATVLMILAGGILVTNLAIRWLDRRLLAQTRVDKGVQDSIRKGASYVGYVLAFGMAVTAVGLDLSNLAIVAGALGVGIGFGLQSIVNNFVSGLILLLERPVRVGDWVVLDAGEGLVKRINVRSTEIETFDACSIIVPNSSLVNGVVRNWTHGDTMGKFTVAVSVVYGSDAEVVHELLLEAARSHPKVLTFPEPLVFLQRFGPYGLDFEIKAAVADIFLGAFVANDLRQTILKVFAEKAITIAQPLGLIQPLKMQ